MDEFILTVADLHQSWPAARDSNEVTNYFVRGREVRRLEAKYAELAPTRVQGLLAGLTAIGCSSPYGAQGGLKQFHEERPVNSRSSLRP